MKDKKKGKPAKATKAAKPKTPKKRAPKAKAEAPADSGEKTDRQLRAEANQAQRTREQDRLALKKKVRMFYDLQRLRLQTEGRTYDRATEIELHEVDQAILEQRAKELHAAERHALADVEAHLQTWPIYRDVLTDKERFRGLGPTMSAVILSEFDIFRLNTPSQAWSFAGLAPVTCRRCKACQDVVVEIVDGMAPTELNPRRTLFKHVYQRQKKCPVKDITIDQTFESARAMTPEKGEKLPFNRFLKTKLVGVMGDCLIKANSPWRKYYDDYKNRKATAGWGRDDGHRHRAAIRYMVKQLILTIWIEWRQLENLPVRAPYAEEYQGKKHSGDPWPMAQISP